MNFVCNSYIAFGFLLTTFDYKLINTRHIDDKIDYIDSNNFELSLNTCYMLDSGLNSLHILSQ